MENESVKKSLEKSKNVLEEKRKMVERKNCIKKTKTFTTIAMKFVQEQLIPALLNCSFKFQGIVSDCNYNALPP